MIKLEGKYNNAKIMIDDVEDDLVGQVTKIINHEAFESKYDIALQPDCHVGSGAPIGFTYKLDQSKDFSELKLVPNIVGYDISCGLTAYNLGKDAIDGRDLKEVDNEIRERIPMGTGKVHERCNYHLKNQFPWHKVNKTLKNLENSLGIKLCTDWFSVEDKYDMDYVRDLVDRIGIGLSYLISSIGSKGSNNHFLEISKSEKTNYYYAICHSGSRGPGAKTAQFWIDRATELRNMDQIRGKFPDNYSEYVKFNPDKVSDESLFHWVTGGMGESHIKKEKVREDFSGQNIQTVFNKLNNIRPDSSRNNDLDYLKGEEMNGYLIDMVFLNWYAKESRREMLNQIVDILDCKVKNVIESIHNFIDFKDLVVRKGAVPAREGEVGLLPLNPAEGTLIFKGKGNEQYLNTGPHGAGRVMSRTEAKDTFSEDKFEEAMEAIYSSYMPLDECPDAYKSSAMIKQAIEPTADVIDHLTPVLNVKA